MSFRVRQAFHNLIEVVVGGRWGAQDKLRGTIVESCVGLYV